ncbi:MAG: hypothetical protein F4Y63_00450 [Chloroflexi bacterium]|nr:hypothetical protein [Chloroflexota bacterium]MYK60791.1 hypothetical protein [Chloroflexota bacterium]
MKSPTSLIRFRNAVGVMLAMSAIFAVVVSTISMPGDRAFGQTATMTNSAKVQGALDALEAAAADPDFNDSVAGGQTSDGKITQLQAAVAAIPTNIAPDADNNDAADVDDDNNPLPNFAIEVDNPGYDADETAAEYAEKISANAALTDGGGSAVTNGLNEYLSDLAAARLATDGTSESEALAAANTAFTALRGALWDSDTVADTDALALSDATKSTLDGLNNGLLTSTPDDLAAFRTSVEDALKNDANWYPEDPATALPTANLTEADGTTTLVIADQLNALFNPNTADDGTDDTGALVTLTAARTAESTALAGAKAILEAVKMAVDGATLPAVDMAIYTAVSPRTTEAEEKAEADMQLATAKMLLMELVGRLNASNAEEFTAFDELAALKTALRGGMGSIPSIGVTMKRLDAIETALLKNNAEDLADSSDGAGDGELSMLKDDSLTHIITALGELSDLDGTGAQMMAMRDLDALLTAVDNSVMKTMFTADTPAGDLSTEAMAVSDALAAFAAVKTALLAKHVDPADVDAATMALNTIADGDVGAGLNGIIEAAAPLLNTDLIPDAEATTAFDESALFTALKSSILASALPEEPSATDAEVTAAELSMALGLTRTEPDPATPEDSADDTLATNDFAAFLNNVAMLEDIIDTVDITEGTTGIQASTALDALVTALEATVNTKFNAADTDSGDTVVLDNANERAEDFRSSTLAYNDFSAVAALQAALGDLDGGDLDTKVKTARDALIAAYDNRDGLNADAEAEISTAYQELISKGSTQHAFAQKAALLELKSALETAGDDSNDLEMAIQNALTTQSPEQQQAQAMISRIEPAIRGATVSGGDKVTLEVKIYGLQNVMDQKLAYGTDGEADTDDDPTFDWGSASSDTGPSITYTAPNSPGTHTVTASLDSNECYHADSDEQMEKCSASFEIRVRRPSAPQQPDPAPVNPPGDIPELLADDGGNQYAVFTPEEGGTFDAGEGYSITAAAGAVPNNEFIGIRMSDDGAASNAGMTHQRYTLGGNMYGVHAVDSSSQAVSSYALDDPATVCVPLPDELRQNISELAVVAINGDGSLTILSAQVRISDAGTMVCGGLSNLPASVAVGSAGAPAAIPTPTPEPTPEAPDTGGTAPASSTMVLWALLLGIATLALGSVLVIGRRRESVRK